MQINRTELIKNLRIATQAGMRHCIDALEEANWNFDVAVDIVKIKGLSNVSSREAKVSAEGIVSVLGDNTASVMVEVNSETDFTAKNSNFTDFASQVTSAFHQAFKDNKLTCNSTFVSEFPELEVKRKELIASTGENIVVRRWWAQDVTTDKATVVSYMHPNHKLAVLVSFAVEDASTLSTPEFKELSENVAMQIAATNPLTVSRASVSEEDVARQKGIFEGQLQEMNKLQAAWPKILEGKFNKWYTEVCLMDQEAVMLPKTSIASLLAKCNATVLSFVRCQVGEGLEKKVEDLAKAVAETIGNNG